MSYLVANSASTVKAQSSTINSRLSTTEYSSKDHCYTCVDDYAIPPCTGFSKDYSCLPNLGGQNQQN
ncbi:MAG TPA: hypothetical protein DCF68_06815 [Cyanothece sp. UBA12306]|nr:hypothetical protein [Cyanothece sp. UBA12306]